MEHSRWIPVGRLFRARGLRGELTAEIYSSRSGRADTLKQVVLDAQGRQRDSVVENVWFHNGTPVFKFAGIDSMSDAEAWEGADILVPPEQRQELEEGEYSHADLIGCVVYNDAQSDPANAAAAGNRVGTVAAVEEFGGPPLLKVILDDGREMLIPFARSICRHIDVNAKSIRVALPEGLADL